MEKYYAVWRKYIPTDGLIFFVASEDWLNSREQKNVINVKKTLLKPGEEQRSINDLLKDYPPPTEEELDKCYGMTNTSASQNEKPKQEEQKTE